MLSVDCAPRSVSGDVAVNRRTLLRFAMVSSMAAPCMACSATIGPPGAAITAHGEGVSPQLVGSNGLLIDPAALSPTPSVTVTAERDAAAKLLGLDFPSPDAQICGEAIRELPASEATLVRARLAYGQGQSVLALVKNFDARCNAGDNNCTSTLRSLSAFLHVIDPDQAATLDARYPATALDAVEPLSALDRQYVAAVRGTPAAGNEGREVVREAQKSKAYLRVPEVLWKLAVIGRCTPSLEGEVRSMVTEAVSQTHVQGLFSAEVRYDGDLITTWALLHLCQGVTSGVDRVALSDAIRKASGHAPDQDIVAQACLSLLNSRSLRQQGVTIALTDPDGPYNPFLVLAAHDTRGWGKITQTPSRPTIVTPPRLASWLVTERLVHDMPPALSQSEVDRLSELADNAENYRTQLLFEAALAAGGRARTLVAPDRCSSPYSWLIRQQAGIDLPDIRASLLEEVRASWK